VEATVAAVHKSGSYSFSKRSASVIELVQGLGVQGDVHAGTTVKHRSRVARHPSQPNLRQVHLVHGELHEELATQGFAVEPGAMGENITTRGIDLLGLPTGACLHLGADAVVEVTGLRNPCRQLDGLHAGLMAALLDHDVDGNLVRKAGIMGIVHTGGLVTTGDVIVVEPPAGPYRRLQPV
jgi:MOSC domain-containing protein YiiM